ncbi:hypothetical protein Rhow_003675 [Rhodococcus wratislaviensis]|uniref:Uncharacterized protein n=1 Tax=Rhodococcus wratislaviensis TaxID=44752 RepID=A0A402C8T2_RHOWR|nr:hypothetical protein Rhow_003675 [Rhodococcus wratislaviensis]
MTGGSELLTERRQDFGQLAQRHRGAGKQSRTALVVERRGSHVQEAYRGAQIARYAYTLSPRSSVRHRCVTKRLGSGAAFRWKRQSQLLSMGCLLPNVRTGVAATRGGAAPSANPRNPT